MRLYKKIPIHCIVVKDKLPITPKAMEFAEALKRGDKFPPIKLEVLGNGSYILLDGRNRFSAHKLAGKERIFASVSQPDAIPCDPVPEKPLVYNGKSGFEQAPASIPQADGYSLTDESWKE